MSPHQTWHSICKLFCHTANLCQKTFAIPPPSKNLASHRQNFLTYYPLKKFATQPQKYFAIPPQIFGHTTPTIFSYATSQTSFATHYKKIQSTLPKNVSTPIPIAAPSTTTVWHWFIFNIYVWPFCTYIFFVWKVPKQIHQNRLKHLCVA